MRVFISILLCSILLACRSTPPDEAQLKKLIDDQDVVTLKSVFAAHPDQLETELGRRTLLHYAAWADKPEVARLLIELGVSPDETDSRGQTVLVTTTIRDASATALVVCEGGADVNLKAKITTRGARDPDFKGLTALEHAAANGAVKTAEVLLEHGATEIDSAREFALDYHQEDMLKLLRRHLKAQGMPQE